MRIRVDQTGICEPANIARGNDILSQKRLSKVKVKITEERQISASARAIDLFNFVSHPQLRIHENGERLLYYRCDCPDYRLRGRYCEHCAALAEQLGREDVTLETPLRAGAFGAPEDPEVPEFRIEEDPFDDLYEVSLRDLTLRYANSAYDLYPNPDPSLPIGLIPYERYIQLYGLVDGDMVFQMHGNDPWGGSCFGMCAVSEALFDTKSGVNAEDFRPGAVLPSQVLLNDRNDTIELTLLELIEMLYLTQFSNMVCASVSESLRDIVLATDRFSRSGEHPILLGIFGLEDGEPVGHAIIPYRFLRHTKNNAELLIADPNFPGRIRSLPLEIDDHGNLVHWRYFMNDQYMWGDDVPGSGICSFTYDSIFQFWKIEYEHAPKGNPMRLQLAANTVVEDNLGSRVLEIGEDGVKTYRDDVREVHVFDGPAKNGKHMFFLNSGAYLIRSTDPECETLEFRLTCGNHAAAVSTQSETAAIFISDAEDVNSVSVQEKDRLYRIELNTEKNHALERAVLSGTTGEYGVTFARVKGELCAEHAENAELRINDEVHALSELKALEQQEKEQEKEKVILFENAAPPAEPEDPAQDE